MEKELVLGIPRELFAIPFSDSRYDVASDGQHFVVNVPAESEPPPRELVLVKNWTEELKRLVATGH